MREPRGSRAVSSDHVTGGADIGVRYYIERCRRRWRAPGSAYPPAGSGGRAGAAPRLPRLSPGLPVLIRTPLIRLLIQTFRVLIRALIRVLRNDLVMAW
ncbi:hypothetical protein GCM10010211_25540 [Streptomyces albospinus]|uniref:Uncharacterized protein n=1 Tax=Streptomyces albospinus TaxID=285515 RepID=A0ABQ2V0M1_9ACTN|nr:hypothetical protein GCM10010211_25540 [Streptomyces albospinus]